MNIQAKTKAKYLKKAPKRPADLKKVDILITKYSLNLKTAIFGSLAGVGMVYDFVPNKSKIQTLVSKNGR